MALITFNPSAFLHNNICVVVYSPILNIPISLNIYIFFSFFWCSMNSRSLLVKESTLPDMELADQRANIYNFCFWLTTSNPVNLLLQTVIKDKNLCPSTRHLGPNLSFQPCFLMYLYSGKFLSFTGYH